MDVLTSYAGLTTAFLSLSTMLSYLFIKSKASLKMKFIVIPFLLWFSVALYFVPSNLMGWPTSKQPPENSVIISYLIKEPRAEQKGFIDLLIMTKNDEIKSLKNQLNPVHIFRFTEKNTERLFRLPYSRDLHKRIFEAKKKAGNSGIMKLKKMKKGKGQLGSKRHGQQYQRYGVEVLHPEDFLPEK